MYQKRAKKAKIGKQAKTEQKTVNHSPTLKTIKMVEDILKNLELYTIKFSDLKKQLPKQVNHNTLKEIIRYLEQSGKVYVGIDGITWIYNPSKKLAKIIEESSTWEELKKQHNISGNLPKNSKKVL